MQWVAQIAVACLFVAPQATPETELLFFTAPQCVYCEQVKPVVGELQARGYPIRTVDYAVESDVVAQFQIKQFPTFLLMYQGRVVDAAQGAISGERMIAMLESTRAISGPAPQQAQQPSAMSDSRVVQASYEQAAGTDLSAPPRATTEESYAPNRLADSVPQREYEAYQVGFVTQHSLAQQRALAASVRIEVVEASSLATGSGTIIDQRQFDANSYDVLVLSCGHLFREAGPQSEVEVEIGFPEATQKYPAMVLSFDSERHDVALLTVRVDRPVTVAPMARPDYPAMEGDEVFSVGCSNGDDPTVFKTRIKALTQYSSALKIDTFGRPEQGRSGGGLFTAGGQLIGVCNASAVNVDEGIFAGREGLISILQDNNLADLMMNPEFLAQRDPLPAPVNPYEGFPGERVSAPSAANEPVNGMVPVASVPSEITVMIPDPDRPGETKVIVIKNPSQELIEQLQEQARSAEANSLAAVPSYPNVEPNRPMPAQNSPWQSVPNGGSLMRSQSPQ